MGNLGQFILGFGDLVQTQEKELLLLSNSKGPLFESSLTLNCYPIEFVFAEKLETAIFTRGREQPNEGFSRSLYYCQLWKNAE